MRQRTAGALVIGLLALALLFHFYYPPTGTVDPGQYNSTTVTISDENGTELGTVDVRLADTRDKRYVGLSETDSLEYGEGMLFIHPSEGTQGYVMRNMSFPIDIIFIDRDMTITTIHHAHVPDGSYEKTYEGRAKYVLEVPRGWTDETGVDPGDTVELPDSVETT